MVPHGVHMVHTCMMEIKSMMSGHMILLISIIHVCTMEIKSMMSGHMYIAW